MGPLLRSFSSTAVAHVLLVAALVVLVSAPFVGQDPGVVRVLRAARLVLTALARLLPHAVWRARRAAPRSRGGRLRAARARARVNVHARKYAAELHPWGRARARA